MGIDATVITDLSSYFKAINEIKGKADEDSHHPPVLWFRG